MGKPIVLLHGEETFLIDFELDRLEKECAISGPEDLNRQVYDASEVGAAEVVNSARTLAFMGGTRLVIVKGVGNWRVEQWDILSDYSKKANPSTCLVLITDKVDKRRTWYKTLTKNADIIACQPPADAQLGGWIKRMADDLGLSLGGRVSQSLILRVGPDLQLLWREIQKLQAYAGDDGRVSVEDVELLVGESRGASVFVFCDALGERDLKKALGALRRLLELGEAPLKLLFMITRHFRILWKAWELSSGGNVSPSKAASVLGCPPFAAKRALEQSRRWNEAGLEQALGDFLEADLLLKSGGGQEVVHKLVVELCTSGK